MATRLLGPVEQVIDSVRSEGLSLTLQKSGRRIHKIAGVLQPRLVRLDRILRSGEHAMPAGQYARITGDLLRPSRSFVTSPHIRFLESYKQIGDRIFEPKVFCETPYFRNASECLRATGRYFHCVREDQISDLARQFIARFTGDPVESASSCQFRESFSPWWKLPTVRKIRWSDYYELLDGNHRLAIDWIRGKRQKWVWVVPGKTITPMQQLVLDVTWTRGSRELYQPLEMPELGRHWRLVRRCEDRLKLIEAFLGQHNLAPSNNETSLDVACSYGWFVREFRGLGFEAHGIELDWASVQIGQLAYGLSARQVSRGDVVEFLSNVNRRFDVLTCFSLLHHFVLGRGRINAVEMIRLLDRTTERVLFLDTGQEHERWFSKSLNGWDADFVEEFIKQNTTFRQVIRLGTDEDDQRYAGNYGRTLFACMR